MVNNFRKKSSIWEEFVDHIRIQIRPNTRICNPDYRGRMEPGVKKLPFFPSLNCNHRYARGGKGSISLLNDWLIYDSQGRYRCFAPLPPQYSDAVWDRSAQDSSIENPDLDARQNVPTKPFFKYWNGTFQNSG